MKKRKIILAVLASLCVSACAAGVAGCNPKDTDTHDSAIYGIYLKYCENVESKGEQPKSYEDWLASLFGDGSSADIGGKDGKDGIDGTDGKDGKDGEDGVGIEDINIIEINGKQYFEFIMSSGRIIRIAVDGSDRQESTGFIIKAIDQNGDPVENAYFNVGYNVGTPTYQEVYLNKDGKTVSISQAYAVKTNSKGIAALYCFPEETDKPYSAYIVDPLSQDGIIGVPDGYTVNFGSNFNNAPFEKNGDYEYNVTVNFILSNSWGARFDSNNNLIYKRYLTDMGDESNNYQFRGDPTNPDDLTVRYTPLVKRVDKNQYNYFSFSPASAPNYTDDDQITAYNYAQARIAASGVYRFYLNTNNSSANVTMFLYSFGNGNYVQSNDDYSPADTLVRMHTGNIPSDEDELREIYNTHVGFNGNEYGSYENWLVSYKEKFSGTNYIDLEVTYDKADATFCFGFISDANCNVTITVERIGEAAKWESKTEIIPFPSDAARAPSISANTRVKDVPFNSTIVLGSDGYYHIGSASGDIVYVQLNNATRVNENSMKYLAHYEITDRGNVYYHSSFIYTTDIFDEANNSGIHLTKDYSNVVLGYSDLADENGLYPVTELMKTILEQFCKEYSDWTNYPETYWLAACYYYGPQPDGTQANPYELTVGNTEVTLNSSGTTYVSYKPTADGYYGFASKTNNVTLTINGAVEFSTQIYENSAQVNYNFHYVKLTAQNEFVFRVNGTGTVNIGVITFDNSHTIEYSLQSVGDGMIENNTESNPTEYRGSGVYLVNVDHVAYNHPIVIKLRAQTGGAGEYVISVHGGINPTVLINNQTSAVGKVTLKTTAADALTLYIDDVENGSFFIHIEKVVSSTSAASETPVAQAPALEAKYRKY